VELAGLGYEFHYSFEAFAMSEYTIKRTVSDIVVDMEASEIAFIELICIRTDLLSK
jgi:hypothetical protein